MGRGSGLPSGILLGTGGSRPRHPVGPTRSGSVRSDGGNPCLEDRIDGVGAFMNAARSQRAEILGSTNTAASALKFAATHSKSSAAPLCSNRPPEGRGAYASSPRPPARTWEHRSDVDWETPSHIDRWFSTQAPSPRADPEFKPWFGRGTWFACPQLPEEIPSNPLQTYRRWAGCDAALRSP
jgi:hypothetical protein